MGEDSQTNTTSTSGAGNPDILSMLQNYTAQSITNQDESNKTLTSIDTTLKTLLKNSPYMTQSKWKEYSDSVTGKSKTGRNATSSSNSSFDFGKHSPSDSFKKASKTMFDSFDDAFTNELKSKFAHGLGVDAIKGDIGRAFNGLAAQIGVKVEEIPAVFGKAIARSSYDKLLKPIVDEQLGKVTKSLASSVKTKLADKFPETTKIIEAGLKKYDDEQEKLKKQAQSEQNSQYDKFRNVASNAFGVHDNDDTDESEPVASRINRTQSAFRPATSSSIPNQLDDIIDILHSIEHGGGFSSESNKKETTFDKFKDEYGNSTDENSTFSDRRKKSDKDDEESVSDKIQDGISKAKDFKDKFDKLTDSDDISIDDIDSSMSTGDVEDGIAEESGSEITDLALSGSESGAIGEGTGELATVATDGAMAGAEAGIGAEAGAAVGADAIGAILPEIATALAAVAPEVLAIIAALALFKVAVDATKKVFDYFVGEQIEYTKQSAKDLLSDIGNNMRKTQQMLTAEADLGAQRLKDDVETYVKEPFEILKDAANDLYSAWDNNIREINQTQGYNKEDLQDLISSFAERLRSEGLDSVISSADITNDLTKVLEAGLTGTVAEEFAYLAEKLNAAIPTQDFFQYADEYAQIAANMMQNGASQSEAIASANEQLETFASSVLYASRELTGGFATGLTNAESIFESAVKITQSAGVTDSTELASVMTSISAITGAIAPDLASDIMSAVEKAATGGNSSDLVALRSLAGINASNTEFLNALVENPKEVFSDLFDKLAEMQNMSEDNYMEVAEGLSSLFGISMDSLSRIDFSYVADAIRAMTTSTDSLNDNMDLLASGESTTTAEEERMQQINEYMIDNGLSYVLDNEAARTIQEHMWDEQMKQDLMEAEYGVNIVGDAMKLWAGIQSVIQGIADFLTTVSHPFSSLVDAILGEDGEDDDSVNGEEIALNSLQAFLEAGKIGSGNRESLYNLTTRGTDLDLVDDLLKVQADAKKSNSYSESGSLGGASSEYHWSMVSKSAASALGGSGAGGSAVSGISSLDTGTNSSSNSISTDRSNLSAFLNNFESYMDSNPEATYDEWIKTSSNYGISDLEATLDEVGATEADLRSLYASYQTNKKNAEEEQRNADEEAFWNSVVTGMDAMQDKMATMMDDADLINENIGYILEDADTMRDLVSTMSETLEDDIKKYLLHLDNRTKDWRNDWKNYYLENSQYDVGIEYDRLTRISTFDRYGTGDAVYELADILTANATDLTNPTKQTNALLAQILKVVAEFMLQEGLGVGQDSSLPDSYKGLATGNMLYQYLPNM